MKEHCVRALVLGSGGREHALCWALSRSPLCRKLFCIPGNPGIAQEAICVPLGISNYSSIIDFAKAEMIDLVVVGPEAPLVDGLSDHLLAAGVRCVGPSANAAILEGSKGFMKDLLAKYNIPTANYGRFYETESAKKFARSIGTPIVIKTDGLAAGKGVTICHTFTEVESTIDKLLMQHVCSSSSLGGIVIESFLYGEEISFFALVDGVTTLPLAVVQDHKAVGEGDTGLNTGGMGAYSPVPLVTPSLEKEIMESIILPTVNALEKEGRSFQGVLFAGLMIDSDGHPKVLEFNVRFGDPECQILMMRLESDLLTVLLSVCEGTLSSIQLSWYDHAALTVVVATNGYPGNFVNGSEIRGLQSIAALPNVRVFHSGTQKTSNGRVLANGGRVLSIASTGSTVKEAQASVYSALKILDWPEGFYRKDIGWRAIKPLC